MTRSNPTLGRVTVTFTARKISSHVDDYRCNETGVHYQIRRLVGGGFIIGNSGVEVAYLLKREEAMTCIENIAKADRSSVDD